MYKVGDKIKFKEEKRPYVIQALDESFLVCTKSFNLQHTVQYTIVDLKEGIRGADNFWKWGGYYDYKERSECEKCLRNLQGHKEADEQKVEISHRNVVKLNIDE